MNKITISFKKNEVEILKKFKEMYSMPTGRIKDLMKDDIQNHYSQGRKDNITHYNNLPFIDSK